MIRHRLELNSLLDTTLEKSKTTYPSRDDNNNSNAQSTQSRCVSINKYNTSFPFFCPVSPAPPQNLTIAHNRLDYRMFSW